MIVAKAFMPVLLQIAENPNCERIDAQVFQCRAVRRVVTHVLWELGGDMQWCPVTGLNEGGVPTDAWACLVEDSGDGACYLVVGGEWGLRLKRPADDGEWNPGDARQWGVPYFLLAGDGGSLRFAE